MMVSVPKSMYEFSGGSSASSLRPHHSRCEQRPKDRVQSKGFSVDEHIASSCYGVEKGGKNSCSGQGLRRACFVRAQFQRSRRTMERIWCERSWKRNGIRRRTADPRSSRCVSLERAKAVGDKYPIHHTGIEDWGVWGFGCRLSYLKEKKSQHLKGGYGRLGR